MLVKFLFASVYEIGNCKCHLICVFFISASYLALSLAANASYLALLEHFAHLAPSSLPTSGTLKLGLSFMTAGRSSLAKYMNADKALFGALGSLAFFAFFSVFSTLPLATFFSGEALAGDFAAFLAGDLAAFLALAGDLAAGAFLAGDLEGAFFAGVASLEAAFLTAAFLAGVAFLAGDAAFLAGDLATLATFLAGDLAGAAFLA